VRVSPETYRHAIAAETDTVVIAVGREVSYEISTSEWIERARPYIRSDPERAQAIIDELREQEPGSRGVAVAEALLLLGEGRVEESRQIIHGLLSEQPAIRGPLLKDPDLRTLVGDG